MGRQRKPLTDEERAAKREEDRRKAEQAVETLRTSAGWLAWLSTRRHFHRYSFINQLLIASQRADATRVAGFRAWLNLGYCVAKGEKAIYIWTPVPPSKKRLEEWRAAGGDPRAKPRTMFRLGPVFDRAQIVPLDPPAEPKPLDMPGMVELEGDSLAWATEPLTAFAESIGSTVSFKPLPGATGGYYELATKAIVLADGAPINRSVSTLVHELAHALVRRDRQPEDPAMDYATEELVAEMCAYSVCSSVGFDTGPASFGYLASWLEGAEPTAFEKTAALVDRLARQLETVVLEAAQQDEQTDELQPVFLA